MVRFHFGELASSYRRPMTMPSRAKRIAIGLSVALLLAAWALTVDGFFVAPDVLRWTDQERGQAVADAYAASLENVSIRASDGATMKGWLFTPQNYHRRAVLLVHPGLGNRRDMLGRAEWLLDRGYACLLVDQRGCGTSGGSATWGVKEPADLSAWAAWLRDRTHASAVFGCGVSRGATNLIQSLALKAPFKALALEAAGSGNIAQPYQFISDKMGMPERKARMMWWPLIEPTFWWIRLRHGFDMRSAQDGVAAIHGSQVAVLLFHGAEDRGAALAGVERLRDANPEHTDLVVIRGADHQWFSPDRPEVMTQILAWFDAHAQS